MWKDLARLDMVYTEGSQVESAGIFRARADFHTDINSIEKNCIFHFWLDPLFFRTLVQHKSVVRFPISPLGIVLYAFLFLGDGIVNITL